MVPDLPKWRRPAADPVEQTMRALSRQGTGMARVAHISATLMVVLFSLGSLVALSGAAFSGMVATVQRGGVPSLPEAISIAVSTLMVVCCDIGLVYAAMTLRVLRTRGAQDGLLLHWLVLVGVSVIEAGTYLYMSALYEQPLGWAWALVIARALAAPLLSVYLSMARAHPITPRDILHHAELAQGIQLVRDVVRVAQEPSASLADKMRLYEASAEMGERDKSRLQQMIAVVQTRLASPTQGSSGKLSSASAPLPELLAETAVHLLPPGHLEAPDARDGSLPSLAASGQDVFDDDDADDKGGTLEEMLLPRGRYNPRRVTERIEATR
jgi:hypothetical protein